MDRKRYFRPGRMMTMNVLRLQDNPFEITVLEDFVAGEVRKGRSIARSGRRRLEAGA
jgi:hypothetical protein